MFKNKRFEIFSVQLTVKNKVLFILFIVWLAVFLSYSCIFFTSLAQASGNSAMSNHGMTTRKLEPHAKMIYEQVIWPHIKDLFKVDVSDEYIGIVREITYDECMRFEVIDGRDTYYVHIEFSVTYTDKTYNSEPRTVVKGQEILFVEKNDRVVQIHPFDEYVILEE